MKSEKVARKVFRSKKKTRKHRSVSELNGSEIWAADISRHQSDIRKLVKQQ